MNPDRLSRQAIRLAQRKSRKAGRLLTREEILRLHVQTVEPWKRILIVTMGLVGGAFSFLCFRLGAPVWIWAAFALCSAIIATRPFFGQSKSSFHQMPEQCRDTVHAPERFLKTIRRTKRFRVQST